MKTKRGNIIILCITLPHHFHNFLKPSLVKRFHSCVVLPIVHTSLVLIQNPFCNFTPFAPTLKCHHQIELCLINFFPVAKSHKLLQSPTGMHHIQFLLLVGMKKSCLSHMRYELAVFMGQNHFLTAVHLPCPILIMPCLNCLYHSTVYFPVERFELLLHMVCLE